MFSAAQFSADRKNRYLLWRFWDYHLPFMTFVGLNPSVADETRDDATIRKVKGFAVRNGYGRLYVVNLFSLVSTKPLRKFPPETEEAEEVLLQLLRPTEGIILLGWGAQGERYPERVNWLTDLVGDRGVCLGLTRNGQPRHPLYVGYKEELVNYTALAKKEKA